MKIKIVCVGNLKEKYWIDAQNEYLKRLGRFCKVELVELKEKNHLELKEKILNEEAKDIIDHLVQYNILLDVKGKEISSPGLSDKIEKLKLNGISSICFVIGSS